MAMYRNQNYGKSATRPVSPAQQQSSAQKGEEETPVAVNGYQQVVELLEAADPAFRESLLARLSRRDPELGRSLRAHFSQNRVGL
jgi:hypothetical protein